MSSASRGSPARQPALEPEPGDLAAIHDALIFWFAANARDLPWRHTRDPYKILVSEVMLQQIQVARAVPFYLAFVERFPTVRDLAAAPLAEVIRVWADLGRYRRVVNLHRAARRIVEESGGEVPRDVAALQSLPGVGPYTAGAVACFAFEQDVGFLDTNSRRALHRLLVGSDAPSPTASDRELRRLATRSVPSGRGWVWNQALIEFGALHCTARRPKCSACPAQAHCRAYPAILDAGLRSPNRGKAKPPAPYEETNRFYRGRVLAALRELPAVAGNGLDLRALGSRVRADFTDDELPWIAGVVESLERDGLAAVSAVNEERPAYDSGVPSSADVVETVRVSLP